MTKNYQNYGKACLLFNNVASLCSYFISPFKSIYFPIVIASLLCFCVTSIVLLKNHKFLYYIDKCKINA